MSRFSLGGRVVRADTFAPLSTVPLRLVGPAAALAGIAGVQPLVPPVQITWTRQLSGFAGTRWECWERHVQPTVRGITWQQFQDGALLHNPSLQSDRLFKATETYLLPENAPVAPYTWSRRLTGFSGTRWECWEQHVKGQVPGLGWQQFCDDALRYNPQLNADGRVFKPFKSYLIPQRDAAPRAAVTTLTDAEGGYYVAVSNPGVFEIQIELDDYVRFVLPVAVNDAVTQPVALVPHTSSAGRSGTIRSARPDYAALPPAQRRAIDMALFMLGDDRQTFDALPPEYRPMCYGARFLADPNHPHFKDIVCADLVSIALRAAGCDLAWGGSRTNPHMADHYHPARANGRVIEISNAYDWRPGDVLVYGTGDPNSRARHVNLYVGPFSGIDRSGRSYALSEGMDVVEGSMDWVASGREMGTGMIGCNLQRSLQTKRGGSWVCHVRLRELA